MWHQLCDCTYSLDSPIEREPVCAFLFHPGDDLWCRSDINLSLVEFSNLRHNLRSPAFPRRWQDGNFTLHRSSGGSPGEDDHSGFVGDATRNVHVLLYWVTHFNTCNKSHITATGCNWLSTNSQLLFRTHQLTVHLDRLRPANSYRFCVMSAFSLFMVLCAIFPNIWNWEEEGRQASFKSIQPGNTLQPCGRLNIPTNSHPLPVRSARTVPWWETAGTSCLWVYDMWQKIEYYSKQWDSKIF